MDEKAIVSRLSAVGIFGNVILVIFKLYAGIAGKSSAMVSDAIHSMSDIFATLVALIGVSISRKAPDDKHPYGHDRFECLASLVLGLILLSTGLGIGCSGVKTVFGAGRGELGAPDSIALVAAVVSIVTKEAMFRYTMYYAKKLNSSAFMADAWHHRSDAFSSIGSLIGIGGAMLGYPLLDPIAAVAICLCILKVSFDILKDAVEKMLDTSCGPEFEKNMGDFILEQDGVNSVDSIHSRKFGNKEYIDVEISVDGKLSLAEAHEIAEKVHDKVEKEFPDIKHIMIHENPS